MAQVQLKVYATLRSYVGGEASVAAHIQPGQTVQQLLQQFEIPSDQTRILFVNNRAATLDLPLNDGDRVAIFPAIGGG